MSSRQTPPRQTPPPRPADRAASPRPWRGIARLKGCVPAFLRRAWHRHRLTAAMGRLERLPHFPPSVRRAPGSLAEVRLQVVGYFSRPSGVGAAARGFLEAARSAGLNVRAVDCESRGELSGWSARLDDPSTVSLVVMNPDRLAALAARLGPERLARGWTIGHWVWELEAFPTELLPAARLLREVWAPSRFVLDALDGVVDRPLRWLPYAVCGPAEATDRSGDRSARPFTVLTICDLRSEIERKNPLAALAAYAKAFPPDGNARLWIKAQNAGHDRRAWRALVKRAAGRDDVRVWEASLEPREVSRLFAQCDVYLSLHRAEGFGLCLAEAMAHGKPVVATNFSGNTDFLTQATGCPVGYRLERLESSHGPYPRGAQWAQADLDEAAGWLRELQSNRQRGLELGRAAARAIAADYSAAAVGERLREHLIAALGASLGLSGGRELRAA